MRKWIVRNFALGTWVTVFGKTFHTLRAPRVLFPLFVIVGIIIVTDPLYPAFQWWDIIAMTFIALGVWLGFNFFKWSYFSLWPITYEELDDEQKFDYLRGIKAGLLKNPEQENKFGFLVGWQVLEFARLDRINFEKHYYKIRFSGLKSLIPLLLSIILIVVWYLYIFPYFNN